jgi:hypothetical protein
MKGRVDKQELHRERMPMAESVLAMKLVEVRPGVLSLKSNKGMINL